MEGTSNRWFHVPTMPKMAVKMSLSKLPANEETKGAQPRRKAAAAGLGQVVSVTNAGDVLL